MRKYIRKEGIFIETIDVSLDELVGSANSSNLPDPVMYQYYNKLRDRQIIINEEISDCLLESAVIPFIDMDNDGTNQEIEIILSTVGGSVYSGFNLVDQIERAKSPVKIHVMAMAASMGILIAMAGKNNPNVRTVCHPFSVGLLHSGSTYMEGTSHAVKDTFDFSQHYEEKIKNYIISHSSIDEALYEKIERKEYWMDAEEMVRLNIVDEII